MPTYQYACDGCDSAHEEVRSFTSDHPKKCPSCGAKYGAAFRQVYSGGAAPIVYGEPTTVGQQAELNAKRAGKEKMAIDNAVRRARKSGFTGALPDGAKLLDRPKAKDDFGMTPAELSKIKDVNRYIMTGEVS